MATKKRAAQASDSTDSGIGVSERVLYAHLENHIQAEAGMEDLYDALASVEHPYVTYLATLIAEDESRHHRLFVDWMDSIRDMALTKEPSKMPNLDRNPVNPETIVLVERLIEFEKADLAAVKLLRKEVKGLTDPTVWGALVEMLIHDTQKHIDVLKFIKRELNRTP